MAAGGRGIKPMSGEILPASEVLSEVEPSRALETDECVIGADVGGTKTSVGAVDPRGALILRREVPSPSRDGKRMVSALLELLSSCAQAARAEGFRVMGVGIGAAGYILHGEGVVLESPNIAWANVPLREIASRSTGLPVFLDNDANSAAAGEHLAGSCRGVDDFVYLTLGTGIGGGIYAGGGIYRGHRGTAAELGHMTIDPHGPLCGCGRRGCLEALASGTALERQAASLAGSAPGSLLLEMCGGDTDLITGRMVCEAADRGDGPAVQAFGRIGYYLGLGVVNLIHVFDPETVVLGGGVARAGRHLLGELKKSVAENGIEALVRKTRIELSALGGEAGLVGAGAMAWEGIGGRS